MGEELSNARTVRSLLLIPWLRYVRLKNGLAGPMADDNRKSTSAWRLRA
jgi:hypothetical protein